MTEVWFKPPGQEKVLKFTTMERFTKWREGVERLEGCVAVDTDAEGPFHEAIDALNEFTTEFFLDGLPLTLAERYMQMMVFGNGGFVFDLVKLFKGVADVCGDSVDELVACGATKAERKGAELAKVGAAEAVRKRERDAEMAQEVVDQALNDEMLDRYMKVRKLHPQLSLEDCQSFARK